MQTDITSIVFKERCAFNARSKQWQGNLFVHAIGFPPSRCAMRVAARGSSIDGRTVSIFIDWQMLLLPVTAAHQSQTLRATETRCLSARSERAAMADSNP